MATGATHQGFSSSLSSSSSKPWIYDVYLSFRGEDTRRGFTGHLYMALQDAGIRVFMGDSELERSPELAPEVVRAIEGSQISAIVFSRNYAASTWCLDELVKIMECRRTVGQLVCPIYYDVAPEKVRRQTDSFAVAFEGHEERFRLNLDKVQNWRAALTEAANLAGNIADGLESEFIRKIVDGITRTLHKTTLPSSLVKDMGHYSQLSEPIQAMVTSIRQAFSPSSKPDVYLSFRGRDTRIGFTSHLYTALQYAGIKAFYDQIQIGVAISAELLRVVEGSKISVIIFSTNYAASTWCLDELVKIMECRETLRQLVMPIFYDVDPSDVRKQTGSFAIAFAQHEKRFGLDMKKIQRWRDALTEAANLSGWDLNSIADGYEAKFIKKIVDEIKRSLHNTSLPVAAFPVGINDRVNDMSYYLGVGSDDVRMVGIWGRSGIGKTTVAKAVYNEFSRSFEGSSFLANVREVTKQPNGMVALQEQLLCDILKTNKIEVDSVDRGINMIKQRFRVRRVLVIIDDIDQREQLNKLANRHWFGSGSRIIITTRHHKLLKQLEVDSTYPAQAMNELEALELLSWHAFRNSYPKKGYFELSERVVACCGGLPLVLQGVGTFLFGKRKAEWKGTLEKLERTSNLARIKKNPKRSFDGLSQDQKDIFFPDMSRKILTAKYLDEPIKLSRLWLHEDGRFVPTEKSGTQKDESNMYVHPTNTPRNSNKKLVPDKRPGLGKHTAMLTQEEDATEIYFADLEEKNGHLKGLFLYCSLFPSGYEFRKDDLIQLWIAEGFIGENHGERMEDTGSVYFNSLQDIGFFVRSRYDFRVDFDSLFSVPIDDPSNFLYKVNPICLSVLENIISRDDYFRVVDGKLDGASEMTQHLSLICEDIDEMTFGVLKKFKDLRTLLLLSTGFGYSSITNIPRNLFLSLKFLRTLNLSHTLISELPSSIRNLKELRYLDVSNTPITRLPESIDSLHNLQIIKLRGCINFVQLPKGMKKLTNLRHINFDIIRQLDSMPAHLGNLTKLQTLPAFLVGSDDGCGIGELKNLNDLKGALRISRLENVLSKEEAEKAALADKKCLRRLELQWSNLSADNTEEQEKILKSLQPHCGLKELQIQNYGGSSLPTWISSPAFADLIVITLFRCGNCKLLPSIGQLPVLKFLYIIDMNRVEEISHKFFRSGPVDDQLLFPAFPKLERLEVDTMLNLKEWKEIQIGDLPSLLELTVYSCPELVTLPSLSCLKSLKHLEFRHCPKLFPSDGLVLPTSLESFIIIDCPELKEWCCKRKGEDWSKIANVPAVWFDHEGLQLQWPKSTIREKRKWNFLNVGIEKANKVIKAILTSIMGTTTDESNMDVHPTNTPRNSNENMEPDKRRGRDLEKQTAKLTQEEDAKEIFFADLEENDGYLKRLFLYCSLFPSGYEFRQDELVQLWIAEGFIGENHGERMEDTGNVYFNSLEKKGFFVRSRCDFRVDFDSLFSVPIDNPSNFFYKVNPIKTQVLENTSSQGDYFRAVDAKLDKASEMTKHLSLVFEDINEMTFGVLQKFKNLHTLLLLSGCGSSINHVPPNLFFSLKFLRTLNLSQTSISELPSSIRNVKTLRYLDVSSTPITQLPDSIDSLHNLQTIKLRGCIHFVQLPKGLKKLTNLRHIDLDIIRQLYSMPAHLGNLTKLQTLSAFLVGRDDGCRIGELKNLNDLKGAIRISRLENVLSEQEAEEAALIHKKFLHRLELQWSYLLAKNAEEEQERILECLQPHSCLKELQIQNYGGSMLPAWISNPSFIDLVVITLYRCQNCTLLPSIGQLPALKFLSIIEMNEVEEISHPFFRNDLVDQAFPAFPKLERLQLDIMLNLKEWKVIHIGDLPSLRQLTVNRCPELVTLPSLSFLKSLKHLEFRRCSKLLSLPNDGLPTSLESFIIIDCPQMKERCCKGEGEDWSKICKVPSIWFDYEQVSHK